MQSLSQTRKRQQTNLSRLRDLFAQYWLQDFLKQSLADAPFIELQVQCWNDADAYPQQSAAQVATISDSALAAQLVQQPGIVLFLGEAGSGKTLSMLHLAQHVIGPAPHDPEAPVPVYLSLSSWTGDQCPIDGWVIQELSRFYDISRHAAQELLDSQRLLYLFDDFDVVRNTARQECAEQLRQFQQQFAPLGMWVACRNNGEIQELPALVPTQILQIQPMSVSMRDAVLHSLDGKTASLIQGACATNSALQALTFTPLWLNLVTRIAKQQAASGSTHLRLRSTQIKQLQQEILEVMRRQALLSTPARYNAEQLSYWLANLAGTLEQHRRTTVRIEDLQLNWVRTRSGYWLHTIMMGIIAGIGFGLGGPLLGTIGFAVVQKIRSTAAWIALIIWGIAGTQLLMVFQNNRLTASTSTASQAERLTNPLSVFMSAQGLSVIFAIVLGVIYAGLILWQKAKRVDIQTIRFFGWNVQRARQGAILGVLILFTIYSLLGTWIGLFVGIVLAIPWAILNGWLSRQQPALPRQQFIANLKSVLAVPLIAGLGLGLSMGSWWLPQFVWSDSILLDFRLEWIVKLGINIGAMVVAIGGWLLLQRLLGRANRRARVESSAVTTVEKPGLGMIQGALNGAFSGLVLSVVAGTAGNFTAIITNLFFAAGRSGGRFSDLLAQSSAIQLLGLISLLTMLAALIGGFSGGVRLHSIPQRLTPNAGIRRTGRVSGSIAGGLTIVAALGIFMLLMIYAALIIQTGNDNLPFSHMVVAYYQTLEDGGFVTMLFFTLCCALGVILPLALVAGGYHWISHMLIRLLLFAQGKAPLNSPKMLEEVARRGIVYRVGGTYLFVHREMQHYLARLEPQQTAIPAPVSLPLGRRTRRWGGIISSALGILVCIYGASRFTPLPSLSLLGASFTNIRLDIAENGSYAAIMPDENGEMTAKNVFVIDLHSGHLQQNIHIPLFVSNFTVKDADTFYQTPSKGSMSSQAMDISPNGELVAIAGADLLVLRSQSGVLIDSIGLDLDNIKIVTALGFSPDNTLLAYGYSGEETIIIRDIQQKKILYELTNPDSFITDLQFSPNGDRLLVTSLGGKSYLWDVKNRNLLSNPQVPLYQSVFSPDGSLLAARNGDGWLHIWRTSDGELLQTLPFEKNIRDFVFSPDDTLLAISVQKDMSNTEVIFWSVINQEVAHRIMARNVLSYLTFSPDGALMAAGDTLGMIWIYDRQQQRFTRVLRGHIASVNMVFFSADHQQLTSLGNDATLRGWNVETGKERYAIAVSQE